MENKTPVRSYKKWLLDLKNNIQQSRLQTALKVNQDMLVLYWYVGKQLSIKIEQEGWGTKVIEQLSDDLQQAFPDTRGFSFRNLKYMRQFAETYPDMLIGQQLAAQIRETSKFAKKDRGTHKKGTAIVQQVAAQITQQSKSLSKKGIELEKSTNVEIGQQAVAQITQQVAAQFGKEEYFLSNPLLTGIPWGHHILLMDKVDNNEERIWYIEKTVENNWSRVVLQYQLETDLYLRQHKRKKASNFHLTLPKPQADLANQILKDPYVFRFPQIGEFTTERQLEQHLIKHIQEFVMELGAGFAFVGRQVKLKAGRKDYFIDLLFYHLFLRSFIVIELKMEAFEMGHTGQMNGYLNMINKQLKQPQDNASVGIILCASKDNVEVDYALTNINHPIGVSEYTFRKTLPKNLKDKLPSAKQLQDEVTKFLKKAKIAKK